MRARRPEGELGAAWLDLVMSRLRETGRCHVYGFGVFTIATRKSRQVRNPKTKELMMLPETVTVKFKASKRLRKAAQRPVRGVAAKATARPATGAPNAADGQGEASHG